MAEFNVRSDSVDVEQIMRQIRARIREKRGADYTEAELQELAKVKLEKFLDPRGVRSDLVEQFRRHRVVSPEIPKLVPEEIPIYGTHRAMLAAARRVLNPILKLFINPNPIIHAIHTLTVQQSHINQEFHGRFLQREAMDPLFYEVVHNLVLEITRLGIEVHNLKMRVESLSSRMDFDERRSRSLERVVEYRPSAPRPAAPQAAIQQIQPAPARPDNGRSEGGRPNGGRPEGAARSDGGRPEGDGGDRRRRRRRRRRRPGQTLGDRQGPLGSSAGPSGTSSPPALSDQEESVAPSEVSGGGATPAPSRTSEGRPPLEPRHDDSDFDDGVDQ